MAVFILIIIGFGVIIAYKIKPKLQKKPDKWEQWLFILLVPYFLLKTKFELFQLDFRKLQFSTSSFPTNNSLTVQNAQPPTIII